MFELTLSIPLSLYDTIGKIAEKHDCSLLHVVRAAILYFASVSNTVNACDVINAFSNRTLLREKRNSVSIEIPFNKHRNLESFMRRTAVTKSTCYLYSLQYFISADEVIQIKLVDEELIRSKKRFRRDPRG